MQASDLLMSFVLVGFTTNEYIEQILTTSFNPMTNLILPRNKLPTVSIKGNSLPILETNSEFTQSGYFTRVSIYIYGMIAIQFLIFLGVICLILLPSTFLVSLLSEDSKFRLKLVKLIASIGYTAHVTLPMRILQENFLKMIVVLVIEINY